MLKRFIICRVQDGGGNFYFFGSADYETAPGTLAFVLHPFSNDLHETEQAAIEALKEQPENEAYIILPVYIKQKTRVETIVCLQEVSDAVILDSTNTQFTVIWNIDPAETFGTKITYRIFPNLDWLEPNEPGNHTGEYVNDSTFAFGDLTIGEIYEVRVQNRCANGAYSAGEIASATATVGV
jgi:hypothetical protein